MVEQRQRKLEAVHRGNSEGEWTQGRICKRKSKKEESRLKKSNASPIGNGCS
nr:MAG TPA: hypothetical protein [Caudoviricetes sp.]